MTTQVEQHTRPQMAVQKEDRKAFLILFVASFTVFLTIALVGQTLGMQWRSWLPGAEGVKSVTGGVKAAVYTFMSHLQ
jgi:light-harvesting complex 1 beta chain